MVDYGPTAIGVPTGCILVAACGRQSTQRVSEPHRHPQGQLLGSLGGMLSVGTEAGVWVVPGQHATWLPPHHPHWARSHGPLHGWTVYVDEEACRTLPSQPRTIRATGLLREAVLRAATWVGGPRNDAERRIAEVLLDEIRRTPVETFGLKLPQDARLLRVARALIDDPADRRDIVAWAKIAAVSERTLTRRFALETGSTFTAWRQQARLLRSIELLATGLPVTTVALDLGYATASAYIALFKRTSSETPSAYRSVLMRGEAAD